MSKNQGVCGVVTAPDGHVVATHADFERQGYGGFSLEEAQTIRVKEGLKRAFLRAFLFEGLTSKTSGYFCEQFWENAREHGYRMETFPIGYSEMAP
ncbi:hypothetical protein [Mesorhizobium sp. B2-4-7]|uniref:hypothetical protein n=1 Tax=Mesorhizobium sp. B2-4-7 TaxID=2589942 RepID=UPI001126463F|nr:hypothetical protein [Mesorhizobium sp. B2-4-7]TPL30220.1 hypothetical protein FJ946_02845 [Mesorhizobium sp. B2-4-7]